MRRVFFLAFACVLGLLVAEASSAKPQHRPRFNPFVKILKAVEEVGAQVGQGFQLLMGEIDDIGSSQAALLVGQEEILGGQEAFREEVQKLADLVGESILRVPDLLLVPADGQICRDDGESLTVRIANVGTGDAGESFLTVLDVAQLGDVPIPVPALGPGDHFDLVTELRDLYCNFADECTIDVEVDGGDLVRESNESNNLYEGLRCNP